MADYGQAAASWNQYAVDNNLSPEETQAGLNKLATGDRRICNEKEIYSLYFCADFFIYSRFIFLTGVSTSLFSGADIHSFIKSLSR